MVSSKAVECKESPKVLDYSTSNERFCLSKNHNCANKLDLHRFFKNKLVNTKVIIYSILIPIILTSSVVHCKDSEIGDLDLSETPQEPILVLPGDDAFIDCTIRDSANHTVVWKYANGIDDLESARTITADKVRITEDPRFSILHRTGHQTWILKIREAIPSDSGVYLCQVNSDPPISVSRFLTVTYPEAGNPLSHASPFVTLSGHNFTDCCRSENVADICLPFCNIKNLVGQTPSPAAAVTCIQYMTPMVRCLADGRNHLPCCMRQNVPEVCLPSCSGNYNLTRVVDNIVCLQYAAPILSCISQGIETLPPQPIAVTIEPVSSTSLRVKWNLPIQRAGSTERSPSDTIQINVTKGVSFNSLGKPISGEDLSSNVKNSTDVKSIKVDATLNSFTLTELKPFTLYQVVLTAHNKFGSSQPTPMVQSLTAPEPIPEKSIIKSKLTSSSSVPDNSSGKSVKLPDLRKCCKDNGMKSEACIDALCDPTQEYNVSRIMSCSHFANVTFKCMSLSSGDQSECCRLRGVSTFCQSLCKSSSVISLRHTVCFHHFPAFLNCYVERFGVLPSPPMDLVVSSVHHRWALIDWKQPMKRGSTVTRYIVHWRDMESVEPLKTETVTNPPYLLDDLRPGVQYEIYVTALNKYGASQDSVRIDFRTQPLPSSALIDASMASAKMIYNETACCARANISALCLPLCSYSVKVNEILGLGPLCVDAATASIIVRCTVGGRDHKPCCERRGVSPECHGLCNGLIDGTPFQVGTRCGPEGPNILLCVKEGAETLPGQPWDLHAFKATQDSIYLRWKTSDEDLARGPDSVNFTVRYSPVSSDRVPLHPLKHAFQVNTSSTEMVLENLNASTTYSIYVQSINSFGTSLPSFILLVTTTSLESEISEGRMAATIGPPHALEVIHQTHEMISLRWLPPLYISPDATVNYVVNFKPVTDTEWTKIEVNFNSADLAGLLPDTKYAIAVQASTENGYKSHLSETILVFTDPILPVTVDPPVLLPTGPITEGDNVTILCVGRGLPPPVISILLNGQVAYKTMAEKVYYTIPSMPRNITSIGCYAANGVSVVGSSDAHKSILVRIKSTPTASIKEEFLRSMKFAEVRISCRVSGDPKPNVTWYKDGDDQIMLNPGPEVAIRMMDDVMLAGSFYSILILRKVAQMDTGRYICKATNELGVASDSVEMQVVMEKVERSDAAACCARSGVPDECLGACTSRGIDIYYAFHKHQCLNSLGLLILCARDGYDHTQCCQQLGVHQNCLHFCEGVPNPRSKESFCLLYDAKLIVHCITSTNGSSVPLPSETNGLSEDYEFYFQHPEQYYHTSTSAVVLPLLIAVLFLSMVTIVVGVMIYGYRRYFKTRITSGEDVVGFENQSYLRDNDSVDLGNPFQRVNRLNSQNARATTT
ncbi:Ig-like and fibronectin type-III domain-containing protein 2 [Tetranychus urticae]|uniref:Uncharacterized protein n=1 Tax=Tetranychus urticae TaxID=32264 RepID=T1JUP2_TETUR|nr:Ig-like and fibronectin type-III domain-containing protein 2 [Tetranychus urticae]